MLILWRSHVTLAPTCDGMRARLADRVVVPFTVANARLHSGQVQHDAAVTDNEARELAGVALMLLENYYNASDHTLAEYLKDHSLMAMSKADVGADTSTKRYVEAADKYDGPHQDSFGEPFFQVRRWYLAPERPENRIVGIVDTPELAFVAVELRTRSSIGWSALPPDLQTIWLARAGRGGRTRFVRAQSGSAPEDPARTAQVAINVAFADGFRCPLNLLFMRPTDAFDWTLMRTSLSNDCDDIHGPPQF